MYFPSKCTDFTNSAANHGDLKHWLFFLRSWVVRAMAFLSNALRIKIHQPTLRESCWSVSWKTREGSHHEKGWITDIHFITVWLIVQEFLEFDKFYNSRKKHQIRENTHSFRTIYTLNCTNLAGFFFCHRRGLRERGRPRSLALPQRGHISLDLLVRWL